jgi:hypothetical protein
LTQIFTIASPCRRQNPHRVCSYTKPWLQFEGSAIGGPATGAEAARERDDVNAPKSISGLGVNGEARQGCIRRGLWVLTTASKNFRVLRDPCSLARTVRNGYLALASPAALSGETSDGVWCVRSDEMQSAVRPPDPEDQRNTGRRLELGRPNRRRAFCEPVATAMKDYSGASSTPPASGRRLGG